METVSVPVRRVIFERLQKMAVPLIDDASAVIERLIEHWESNPPQRGSPPTGNAPPVLPAGNASPGTGEQQRQIWRSSRGEAFPVGAPLRASYLGQNFEAKVTPDGIEFAGNVYDSPSSAGVAAKNSIGTTGRAASTNGWDFWEILLPETRRWVSVDTLRNQQER